MNDNFDLLAPLINDVVGLGAIRCARFEFDVDEEDSAGALNSTIAAHGVGVTLPANAIVMGGFYDVNTPFTSDSTDAGTLAISVEGANDILNAVAISGNDPATIGRKAIIPKMNTPESTSVKTSQAREVTVTVAVEELLTGKLTGYLFYVLGALSETPASS
ncbi:MAG: hypothetical protein SVT56_04970, partial [Chloroflexota bacterium]|nr:hypothetical protein [Chloroflexota bacterium]